MTKGILRLQFVIAILFSCFYYYAFRYNDYSIEVLNILTPYVVLTVASLLLTIILFLKHRFRVSESYCISFLLLFFTLLGLESLIKLINLNSVVISVKYLEIVVRTIKLSTAVCFLFASILHLKFNARVGKAFTCTVFTMFFLAYLIPQSSTNYAFYNYYILFIILALIIAANATYFVAIFQEKAAYNVIRFLNMLLLSISYFLIISSPQNLVFYIALALFALAIAILGLTKQYNY